MKRRRSAVASGSEIFTGPPDSPPSTNVATPLIDPPSGAPLSSNFATRECRHSSTRARTPMKPPKYTSSSPNGSDILNTRTRRFTVSTNLVNPSRGSMRADTAADK